MTWYYLNESGEVSGPVSEQALKELNVEGSLTDASQICREGTETWVSLSEALEMGTRGGATEEADPDEISAEDIKAGNGAGEPNDHPDERQGEELKHSFADRLKAGAKEGLADIERTSRGAAIHAQIEKLRNVDLRKALFALGTKCYESRILQEELKEQFQEIRDLDAMIASKQESEETVDAETKMDALKRMGKDAAKTSHAQALTVKRQHLVTELGRAGYARMAEEGLPALDAEIKAIEEVEGNVRDKEEEARILGAGHAKGWRNRTPAIAVAAVLILLLIGGSLFGLRMMGVGKDDDYVTSISEKIRQKDEPRQVYKSNQADELVFKKFEEVYETTGIVGKRRHLNELEIILAAIDAMDWSDASAQLKTAVKEIGSIKNGETPDSRNKKMKDFMDMYSNY